MGEYMYFINDESIMCPNLINTIKYLIKKLNKINPFWLTVHTANKDKYNILLFSGILIQLSLHANGIFIYI